jgi:hypothetical protein
VSRLRVGRHMASGPFNRKMDLVSIFVSIGLKSRKTIGISNCMLCGTEMAYLSIGTVLPRKTPVKQGFLRWLCAWSHTDAGIENGANRLASQHLR